MFKKIFKKIVKNCLRKYLKQKMNYKYKIHKKNKVNNLFQKHFLCKF